MAPPLPSNLFAVRVLHTAPSSLYTGCELKPGTSL
jgi:hypothetical protein